jgi:hypothetical protein
MNIYYICCTGQPFSSSITTISVCCSQISTNHLYNKAQAQKTEKYQAAGPVRLAIESLRDATWPRSHTPRRKDGRRMVQVHFIVHSFVPEQLARSITAPRLQRDGFDSAAQSTRSAGTARRVHSLVLVLLPILFCPFRSPLQLLHLAAGSRQFRRRHSLRRTDDGSWIM